MVMPASIYEGDLDCGENATEDTDGLAPGVIVRRLTDADKASAQECTALPYQLTNDDHELEFLKPADQPYTQFLVDVEWVSNTHDPARSDTYVDFDLVPGGYELKMPSCPTALYGSNGALVGIPAGTPLTPAGLASLGIVDQDGFPRAPVTNGSGEVTDPGTDEDNGLIQYACVADRDTTFVPAPPVGVTHLFIGERIYLLGDVIMRK